LTSNAITLAISTSFNPSTNPIGRWWCLAGRTAAKPEGHDDDGRSDEQGDGVGDHQRWDSRRRAVGDPEQKPDEQDREVGDGHLA
jgi:hypothetical protein